MQRPWGTKEPAPQTSRWPEDCSRAGGGHGTEERWQEPESLGTQAGVGVWCRETSWGAVAHLPLQKPALLGCGVQGRMPQSGQKQVPQAPEAQCVARTRQTCGADQHWA